MSRSTCDLATPTGGGEATGPGPAGGVPPAEPGNEQVWEDHSLQALIELSQEIHGASDLFRVAEIGLLNCMGHMGTSSAALWTLSPKADQPVLLRCFGIKRQIANLVGALCVPRLCGQREGGPLPPVFREDLENLLNPEEVPLIRQTKIHIMGVLYSRSKPVGALALGGSLARPKFSETQLQVFEATLLHLGVALENAKLYSNILASNRELEQARHRLREMDKLKEEFLSNMQHELRTPLAIILSGLEMINSQIPDDAPTQEILASVLNQAEKLRRLLENLLAMNDLQNEDISLEVSRQDVARLLREFHGNHRLSVMQDLRELKLEIQPGIQEAFCDPARVIQILEELLQNATKFTPQGTVITLRGSPLVQENGSWTRIELTDDGPGIPSARLAKVFELFQQLDGSLTRSVGGVGLGIPLVRDLSERMGGTLTVQSEPGHGTRCILLLPTR